MTLKHLFWLTFVAAVIVAAYAQLSLGYLWTWGTLAVVLAILCKSQFEPYYDPFWVSFGLVNVFFLLLTQFVTVGDLLLIFVGNRLLGWQPMPGMACFHCWAAVSLAFTLSAVIGLSHAATGSASWHWLKTMCGR